MDSLSLLTQPYLPFLSRFSLFSFPPPCVTTELIPNRPFPRNIHFVWPDDTEFTLPFYHYLAIYSAYRFHQPDNLYLWHGPNAVPTGVWWNQTLVDVKIIRRTRPIPTSIFNNPINVPAHKSDVMRLEALLEEGGLYLDLDVVSIQSLPDEMWATGGPGSDGYHHFSGQAPGLPYADVVMATQNPEGEQTPLRDNLCNAVILAPRPNATFLQTWYATYQTFDDGHWDEHSVVIPGKLAREMPAHDMISVLPSTSFFRPTYWEGQQIYEQNDYCFHESYLMHLWHSAKNHRTFLEILTPRIAISLQTTLGRLARHILD